MSNKVQSPKTKRQRAKQRPLCCLSFRFCLTFDIRNLTLFTYLKLLIKFFISCSILL